jgi:phosphatidylserine synthase
MRKHIPNIITLFNLFFGCWAIVFTFQKGAVASVDQVGDIIIEIPDSMDFGFC